MTETSRTRGFTARTTAAMALIIGVVVAFLVAPSAAVAAPVLNNPSLEAGATFPDCYTAAGWGTEATWSLVPGRTGGRAASLSITGYEAGDRKLLQTQNEACALKVDAGQVYELAAWYTSTAPVALTAFRRVAGAWEYWADFAQFAATPTWTRATAMTPAIPAGTDAIVFGLSLAADGQLITDDYAITPQNAAAAGGGVQNGWLAQGTPTPTCFTAAIRGNGVINRGVSTDIPADAPAGTRSYRIKLDPPAGGAALDGDAKLLVSERAGCAPAVDATKKYTAKVRYKSSSPANALTVFVHTATGWAYWTDAAQLPQSNAWTTAEVELPALPAGVDRISYGVSLSAPGTLRTTGYELLQVADPPPPGDYGPAGEVGEWTVSDTEMPLRAIHTTQLSDGRVLLIAGSGNDGNRFAAGQFDAMVWNPTTDTYTDVPVPYDMFCAGHMTLPDGKVLIAGGTEAFPTEDDGPTTFKGSAESYYFDPDDDTFHPLADMAGAHWYPSLTKLANGDVWAAGGLDEKAEGTVLTEMFDTSAMTWLPANQVPQTWSYWGTYPHMYLLDDGMLFYSGAHTFGNGLPGTGASVYDWQTAQIWDVPGLRSKDLRDQAGSVLLPPAQDQKVMIAGGGNTETNNPAINLVDIIDLSEAQPAYRPGPNVPGPGKMYLNLVTLPDRTVLSSGGAVFNRADNVDTAAIFDPIAEAWTSIAPDPVGRNYHSTTTVLPDGRVVVFGSNPVDNSFEQRVSIYEPPYLHRGDRPTVTGVPQAATYGASITLTVTGDVSSASLMAPMSSTHQTDTNARLVDLPLAGDGAARVAQIPTNANLLPPGPYMLTVLDADGVPSVAEWIWVS